MKNKFLDETDLPPTLISGKSSQENQQFLADFKTQMQDDDVRGKFLESAKENLAMFQNEMQQHVADYRTKILETLHSFNSGLNIASFDNRVSFMTSEEIDVYLEKTGLSSVYEAGDQWGMIVDNSSSSEYSNAICLMTPQLNQEDGSFNISYDTNTTRIVDHELTHLAGNQLHNTEVFSEDGEMFAVIYSGFSPRVFTIDGRRKYEAGVRAKVWSNCW